MPENRFDVLTIGNAIVDVFARTEDDFLVREGLSKGSMTLTSEDRAEDLYAKMSQAVEISGGSAANTIVGVASFGGRGAYFGKVKDDEAGRIFTRDLRAQDVHYETPPLTAGPSTAKSFIFITPDGERTMNTHLGATHHLSKTDIDPKVVEDAAITYMEGYLWDPQDAKDAFLKAAAIAHAAGRRVAITLSDPFCVDRYRAEFLDLMRRRIVDTLFANEFELRSLYETSDLSTAHRPFAQGRAPGGRDALGKGRRSPSRATRRLPCRPCRSTASSTRPGPETCSPRASCSASPGACRTSSR